MGGGVLSLHAGSILHLGLSKLGGGTVTHFILKNKLSGQGTKLRGKRNIESSAQHPQATLLLRINVTTGNEQFNTRQMKINYSVCAVCRLLWERVRVRGLIAFGDVVISLLAGTILHLGLWQVWHNFNEYPSCVISDRLQPRFNIIGDVAS